MQDRILTLDEAAELLPIGRTTVYDWAKKGKIRSEETEFGLRILLNDEEINKISTLKAKKLKRNSSIKFGIVQNDSEVVLKNTEDERDYSEPIQNDSEIIQEQKKVSNNELMLNMLNQINSLHNEVKELSMEAGQVKLLTDNNKFYQDEYFKLKYEVERLQISYNESIQKNSEINSELDRIKQENSDLKQKNEKLTNDNRALSAQILRLNEKLEEKPSWKFWK